MTFYFCCVFASATRKCQIERIARIVCAEGGNRDYLARSSEPRTDELPVIVALIDGGIYLDVIARKPEEENADSGTI